jgi:adenylate kinase family enzyme
VELPPLESFGRRIMICGPSNSGKSTLGAAIARKLDIPTVHLDQFSHFPNTNWVPRPKEEFAALHDAAIVGEEWVMDGNYSWLFPQRFARATGIILLGDNRFANLWRYFRRTMSRRPRAGALQGNRDSIKWMMIHWIVVVSPESLRRYRAQLPAVGLPFIERHGLRELNELYAGWDLSRP